MKKLIHVLKCIFVPFYWHKHVRNKTYFGEGEVIATFFYGAFLILYITFRLGMGIIDANDPAECRVRSIGDVMITPMYTLGCNIGKDRFDIKVN